MNWGCIGGDLGSLQKGQPPCVAVFRLACGLLREGQTMLRYYFERLLPFVRNKPHRKVGEEFNATDV